MPKRFLGNVTLHYSDQAFRSDVLTSAYAGYTASRSRPFSIRYIQQRLFGDILKRAIVGEVRFQF